MKTLPIEFQTNADGAGKDMFRQIRRKENAAIYERIHNERILGYEVFEIKIVKAGTVLYKTVIEEDYEQYPTKNSFGKNAWFISGVNALERAIEVYHGI